MDREEKEDGRLSEAEGDLIFPAGSRSVHQTSRMHVLRPVPVPSQHCMDFPVEFPKWLNYYVHSTVETTFIC